MNAAAFTAQEALLFAGIGFLIGGIDDLLVDLLWLREKLRGRLRLIDATQLRPKGPPLAIFIAAWDESPVIGDARSPDGDA